MQIEEMKETTTIRVSKEIKGKIDLIAAATGIQLKQLFEEAILAAFEKYRGPIKLYTQKQLGEDI